MKSYVGNVTANTTLFTNTLFRVLALMLCVLSPNLVLAAEKPELSEKSAAIMEKTVSLNNASADELAEALTGIGSAKAAAIIKWRELHGEFTSVDQLVEVKGIGEATLAKNKSKLRL